MSKHVSGPQGLLQFFFNLGYEGGIKSNLSKEPRSVLITYFNTHRSRSPGIWLMVIKDSNSSHRNETLELCQRIWATLKVNIWWILKGKQLEELMKTKTFNKGCKVSCDIPWGRLATANLSKLEEHITEEWSVYPSIGSSRRRLDSGLDESTGNHPNHLILDESGFNNHVYAHLFYIDKRHRALQIWISL